MPKTTHLGGSASNVTVGKVAQGLMMMTWTPNIVPDEQAFESIKAGIEALPPGTKQIINSGEFYGISPRTANLELVSRFFEKYPHLADRAFLSVKGGTERDTLAPNSSPENMRASVNACLEKLRGKKSIDLFECARVDHNYPIEETMKALGQLVEEGKIGSVGLSEVSEATLRRACAVYPVAAAEIEVSPWSYEEEAKKVIAACAELNVAVIAYSPLGRGFLTGKIKSIDDLPKNDLRLRFTRFKEENLKKNLAIVETLEKLAHKKGITPAQLSLAWVSARGPHVIPLPGSSHASRTLENIAGGDVEFTPEEMAEIDKVVDELTVHGDRYFGNPQLAHLHG